MLLLRERERERERERLLFSSRGRGGVEESALVLVERVVTDVSAKFTPKNVLGFSASEFSVSRSRVCVSFGDSKKSTRLFGPKKKLVLSLFVGS